MKTNTFSEQVSLLLRVLPLVATEKDFALKGGTAINLFVRNMPRLSVDIDITFLPILDREASFSRIGESLSRIKNRVEKSLIGTKVQLVRIAGTGAPTSMTIENDKARIRLEVNFILRGTVYPIETATLCKKAQNDFSAFVEIQSLSIEDLYGGKLCAALDRQHPRDLFDVKLLLENEGITDRIRKAFVVYLASHSRPINELLNPTEKDISSTFERDFVGMTTEPISVAELTDARSKMVTAIRDGLSTDEKTFLLSIKQGEPDWSLLGINGVESLPGIQWKLANIRKMSPSKREADLDKLKKILQA